MITHVHTVTKPEEPDGIYVFAEREDAERFASACEWSQRAVETGEEPVHDSVTTDRLIKALADPA